MAASAARLSPLRLGHIVYSNCFPVHARLLDQPAAGDPHLVEGVPSTLNRLLAESAIDVAPASSIEYALHAERYRIIPDLVIGSRGAVRSIILVASRAPTDLDGLEVAIPTASATSVVLLKILCRIRWSINVRFRWFDQSQEDPLAAGASAALFIGDVALRPGLHAEQRVRLDLGAEWWDQTGLPFAFAVWQASAAHPELQRLHATLLESREFGRRHRRELSVRWASHFGMPASELESYWNELSFDLDDDMVEGLKTFYRLATEIGEIKSAPELRWA
jgi:chorismate dehydratase